MLPIKDYKSENSEQKVYFETWMPPCQTSLLAFPSGSEFQNYA